MWSVAQVGPETQKIHSLVYNSTNTTHNEVIKYLKKSCDWALSLGEVRLRKDRFLSSRWWQEHRNWTTKSGQESLHHFSVNFAPPEMYSIPLKSYEWDLSNAYFYAQRHSVDHPNESSPMNLIVRCCCPNVLGHYSTTTQHILEVNTAMESP